MSKDKNNYFDYNVLFGNVFQVIALSKKYPTIDQVYLEKFSLKNCAIWKDRIKKPFSLNIKQEWFFSLSLQFNIYNTLP